MSAGGPKPSSFYVERQALTRVPSTPTNPDPNNLRTSNQAAGQNDPGPGNPTPGDGLVLGGLFAVVLSIYPDPGQTLSGAGNLLCWIYNTYQARWTRCPELDFDLTSPDVSNCPAVTFAPLKNVSRLGMLINWATSSVTASGGADVLLRIDGFVSVLGMST